MCGRGFWKGMSADVGCCSPQLLPMLSSLTPFRAWPWAGRTHGSRLDSVCSTRRKQNQCSSLATFMFAGGSWSWLWREPLSGFIRRSDTAAYIQEKLVMLKFFVYLSRNKNSNLILDVIRVWAVIHIIIIIIIIIIIYTQSALDTLGLNRTVVHLLVSPTACLSLWLSTCLFLTCGIYPFCLCLSICVHHCCLWATCVSSAEVWRFP